MTLIVMKTLERVYKNYYFIIRGLLIGAVAFVLATFSAPFVSKQVADYLVGYQLQEELERNQAEEGMVAKSVTETESSVVGVSVNIGTEVVFLLASPQWE